MKTIVKSAEPREVRGLGQRVKMVKVVQVYRPNGNILLWGRAENGRLYRTDADLRSKDAGTTDWRLAHDHEIPPKAMRLKRKASQ